MFKAKRTACGEGLRYRFTVAGDRSQIQDSIEMSPINLLRSLNSCGTNSFSL